MKAKHWIAVSVIAALLTLALAFGAFVWPTMYRYDHTTNGVGMSLLVRTNRFTGSSEVLWPGAQPEWQKVAVGK